MMTRDEIKSFAIESVEEFEELEFGMCMTWNEIERFAYIVADVGREWVGLTDKEIEDCLEMSIQGTCRAIEAKLKEKNNGSV